MKFPAHKAGLTLSHNDHKGSYYTIKEAIEHENFGMRDFDWVSEEQKQKAIDTDECWTLQWYPDTPVGFFVKSAADLEALLDFVEQNASKFK